MTTESTAARMFLAAALCTPTAFADPPPPKVCIAVAGDPDESVRAGADSLSVSVASASGLRGVADADSRAALRGESPTPEGAQDLATARRALRATDADGALLDPVGERLGCAWFVEVSARPSGFALRLYDLVHHTWGPGREVASIEPSLVTTWILPAMPAPVAGSAATTPHTPPPATPVAAPRPTFLQRSWPWFLVGGAAATVVAVFFLTRNDDAGDVTLRVVHGGAR